jgi:hypothetical protein
MHPAEEPADTERDDARSISERRMRLGKLMAKYVERTSDNLTSVLSAAGTRRRSRGSRQA